MTNYTQLMEKERLEIYKLQKNNFTVSRIAQKLKRDKGTISRELTRNSYHSIGYLPDTAHVIAQKRKHILQFKIDRYPKLKEFIFNKLNAKWSPDVIAAKSKEARDLYNTGAAEDSKKAEKILDNLERSKT